MKYCVVSLYDNSNLIPYQILGGKIVKNVQIDPHTSEICPKQLNVTLSVSDTLVEKS